MISDPRFAEYRTALDQALDELGLNPDAQARGQLLDHLRLIAKWNQVFNLTAVRDPGEMFTHHLLDSLATVPPLIRHLRSRLVSGQPDPQGLGSGGGAAASETESIPIRLLDVGAGAGLPGVTYAISLSREWPLEVVCIDAVAKKAGFIRQVAAELGLTRLQAVHGRVESMTGPAFDVITCRAFASLSDIVRLTEAQLAPHGVWMALKGQVPEAEMADLPGSVEVFHVEPIQVPRLPERRCLVWMRRRVS